VERGDPGLIRRAQPEVGIFVAAESEGHFEKARATDEAAARRYRAAFQSLLQKGAGSDRLVLAWWGIGDLLAGTVPFYELARYDEASALGGANGVRGIRGDRYHGKRKLLGNVELRSTLWQFQVARSRYALGLTSFVDGGRVWADTRPAPELDGRGLGLRYGVGGGLRLRKGQTFVLRADVAWSEDARPLGFYFLAGHLF
jgi:hypothetical protein